MRRIHACCAAALIVLVSAGTVRPAWAALPSLGEPFLPLPGQPVQVKDAGASEDADQEPLAEPAAAPRCRLPAEFEVQSGLLLACHRMLAETPQTFVEIVRAVRHNVDLVAMIEGESDYRHARKLLERAGVDAPSLRYVQIPHDTMWTRDYGPMTLERDGGGAVLLDADYSSRGRPNDDAVPLALASYLKVPLVQVRPCIDGGNLLSNGRGVAVATSDLVTGNLGTWQEPDLIDLVCKVYGFSQLVILEPLNGESTGHVDMFATFVSPGTVVVAACDPQFDPVNAAILDRNAEKLAQVRTPAGRLQVERIPMPRNDGAVWRTYTNVVYANGALLVPIYPHLDAPGRSKAVATYSRLLPGWKIVPIDARPLSDRGGSLHCVTMNLGGLARLPQADATQPFAPLPAALLERDGLAGQGP